MKLPKQSICSIELYSRQSSTCNEAPRCKPVQNQRKSLQAIKAINLSRAKERLMLNMGWTADDTEMAITQYRGFLTLAVKHPNQTLVPSKLVDEVWHQHVLDTRQYPKDCTKVFGEVMHHDPYFGTTRRGKRVLQNYFRRTNRLFKKEFGAGALVVDDRLAHLMEAGSSCK